MKRNNISIMALTAALTVSMNSCKQQEGNIKIEHKGD